jgi:hypothetical protein
MRAQKTRRASGLLRLGALSLWESIANLSQAGHNAAPMMGDDAAYNKCITMMLKRPLFRKAFDTQIMFSAILGVVSILHATGALQSNQPIALSHCESLSSAASLTGFHPVSSIASAVLAFGKVTCETSIQLCQLDRPGTNVC